MPFRAIKKWVFVLEGLNAFACTYYFNYLLFLLRDDFGFGNFGNLLCVAVHGGVYALASWAGGQFAQRRGYHAALQIGFLGMAAALGVGAMMLDAAPRTALAAQIAVLMVWTVAMCFTWPTLQAVISEGESREGIARQIGIYNLVWAGSAAVGYATGGVLFEALGARSLFWLPILFHSAQLVLLGIIAQGVRMAHAMSGEIGAAHTPPSHPEATALRQPVKPETFLTMARVAIPFAYIAINTLLAVIPDRARALNLSTAEAGVLNSLWFFVRLGAFVLLWRWTGWHYRFRWLLAAFAGLAVAFLVLLTSEQVVLLLVAQVVFGFSTGLIYYSSLFYAMDVGEAKGEHGGFHESAIGLGICLGPALGAATLHFAPSRPDSGAWAVVALLACGFVALLWLRWRK
ncbi:MAG: MFS transporter [Pedosphaera sp.]|nr:MFS transporter [Pedosphaera sp.]MST00537.1 MFS transporter [Pedosphaera sp.]